MAATDSGKKSNLDVISDGIFAGAPDVLRRYTSGINIPFGRVIAKDARNALIQAQKNGIRLVIQFPDKAGLEDEHGKPQVPLAG
jgi:glycine cleavage system pyridoxal-binding protein P